MKNEESQNNVFWKNLKIEEPMDLSEELPDSDEQMATNAPEKGTCKKTNTNSDRNSSKNSNKASSKTSSKRSNNRSNKSSNKKSRSSVSKSASKLAGKTFQAGGSLVKGSAKLTGSVLKSGLLGATLLLIVLTMLVLALVFWKNYHSLGSLTTLVSSHNYPLAGYLGVAGLLLLFELLSLLRATTSQKIKEGKAVHRYDTGRGLLSFPIIYIGSYLSAQLYDQIPSLHPALDGVRLALKIYGMQSHTLLLIGLLGAATCIARWLCSRIQASVR